MFKKKGKFKTAKLKKKKRKKMLLKISLYFALGLVIVWGLSALTRANFIMVDGIEVVGNEAESDIKIKKIAERKLDKKILGIFSRSNIFLYPRHDIEREITRSSKRISSASVSLSGLALIKIEVEERQPFALWCGGEEVVSNFDGEKKATCFYMDSESYVFAEAPNFSGSGFVKYYGDLEKDFFLTQNNFNELQLFLNNLHTFFEAKAEQIVHDSGRIDMYLDTGTKVIINLEGDIEEDFENLLALMSDSEFQDSQNPLSLFEKIDLRFGNKIFYRQK